MRVPTTIKDIIIMAAERIILVHLELESANFLIE